MPALHDERFQYQQAGLNLLGRLVKYQFKMTVDDGFNAAGLAWAAMAALTLSTGHMSVEAVPHTRAKVGFGFGFGFGSGLGLTLTLTKVAP